MIGEIVKGFKLTARLGNGAMGEVWAGEQMIVNTKVAIKFIAPNATDPQQVQRFFNEAITANQIRHAGIVKIFDVGYHHDRPYLIMELLEGETLASRLRRGALPMPQIAELGRQITSVLEATRGAGIIHRDLKPENIFLVPDAELPGGERVKILDFGLAKAVSAVGMTISNDTMGTPPYIAPEQWADAASVDARVDTYSFGCILFEMSTGQPPFVVTSVAEACTKHLHVVPPRVRSLAQIPEPLDDLIARMLAKRPGDRPSISELRAVFEWLVTSDVARSTLGGSAAMMIDRRPPGRHRLRWLALGGALAVVAAAATFVVVRSTRDTGDPATSTSTPEQPPPPPASRTPVTPTLQEPKLGLQAIAAYADPTPATLASLRSASYWTAARDDFEAAVKQPGAPARWWAARELANGQIHYHDNQFDAALAAYRRAAARDPKWAAPQIAIAIVLANRSDTEGALAAATRAQRIDPSSWLAVAVAARAYSALPDAIQEYQRARSLAPENAVLLAELALTFHAAGMDREAHTYGDQALAIDDTLVNVHVMRAELALERDDAKVALVEADRALAIAPKHAAAHLARGDALALQNQRDDALAAYARVLELRGDREIGLPPKRMALVEAAVAKHRLPPPRSARAPTGTAPPPRTGPSPNGVKPPAQRTHTTPGGNRPDRTRTNCGAEPLCNRL